MSDNLLNEIKQAQQEIKRLEISLRAEKLRTKISSEYTYFGLWEYDIATDIFYQYKKLGGRYENNLEPIVRFRESMLGSGSVCADDQPAFNRFCDALKRGDREVSCEIRVINENCDIIWQRYEGRAVYDDNDNPTKIVGRTLDVTAEKGSSDDGIFGRRDSLTGTYSAELFKSFVKEKRIGVNRYTNAALLAVGIDNFRGILPRLGAEYSDYIEKTIAKILMGISSCEHTSAVARVRGGEFLMYVTFGETSNLNAVARKILSTVNSYPYDGEPVTVSVGISVFRNGRKLEQVYGESAIALAESRKSGGGCYMHYTSGMTMRMYSTPEDLTANVDNSAMSAGAAKVYELLVRAICSGNNPGAMLKAAFKAAGECIGASNIYIYNRVKNTTIGTMTYNATGLPPEECPAVKRTCSDEDVARAFGSKNGIRIHSGGEHIDGLSLVNGAVCAECRAIRYGGEINGYFVIVFNSSFELTDCDLQIIDSLENALTEIYTNYFDEKSVGTMKQLHGTIINDHHIEGFTIVPGEFKIEFFGDNAADHYDLRPGDICYEKMRHRDSPCAGCPALLLDETGKTYASNALYCEKDHRWLTITASAEENEHGEKRYVISSTDITDCLGQIQMTDGLTGLITFDAFAAEALRMTSEDSTGYRVVVLNIAEFRKMNDIHGFEAGNSLLIATADILQRCTGQDELLCRSEGSRFVGLFKGSDSEEFDTRIHHMLGSVQKQIHDKFNIQVYLLVGICTLDEDNVSVMTALDRAITAQHTVHSRTIYNENFVVYYDGALRDKIKERLFIESNMEQALQNNEFQVYYQPKVSIESGDIVGAEALVRWIRPNGEIISPGKFIPIFEENGFINDMDFAIYRNAVADIAKWLRKGIEVPLISMNVSRYHLGDDNFCTKLNSLVNAIGVPHEYIELEITETLLTDHIEKLVDTVSWFKDRGFRISVDDFGSGYSSLNLITQLPFDTLKIDGGFFLRNDLTDKSKKVISSVVTLAKSLNVETVSEGVETQVQVDFLRGLGCDMIQGFFYYRPMPHDEFEELLAAQTRKHREKAKE